MANKRCRGCYHGRGAAGWVRMVGRTSSGEQVVLASRASATCQFLHVECPGLSARGCCGSIAAAVMSMARRPRPEPHPGPRPLDVAGLIRHERAGGSSGPTRSSGRPPVGRSSMQRRKPGA